MSRPRLSAARDSRSATTARVSKSATRTSKGDHVNPIVAVSELDRVGKALRRHAEEIRACAPAIAAKLDGLSRECETKREQIDRATVVHDDRVIEALHARQCPTPCHCSECRT